MKLFYSIWVDCIIRMKSIEKNRNNWKKTGLFYMSLAMAFNFILIMVVFQKQVLNFYFYEINLSFLNDFLNYAFTILVLYLFPCFLINYLLIFRNNRYEKLLEKYKYHNGKLCLNYYMISFLLPVVLLWIGLF